MNVRVGLPCPGRGEGFYESGLSFRGAGGAGPGARACRFAPENLIPAAASSPPPARAIYGQRMLLCLVIVVHKWQNWTRFQRRAEGKPRRADGAAATKNVFHTLGKRRRTG
ncbi:hypothetical protein ANANG_G00019720 [Anguilla anguilla]|uniref:Uncharacterized protein n=1 Tax=Anguilla anguilla TaxID=7936 RepID=A0A9D3MZ39_ANGAN|nr:hypothetical protein ANANG_G00019720 [Anguilla anguilla]